MSVSLGYIVQRPRERSVDYNGAQSLCVCCAVLCSLSEMGSLCPALACGCLIDTVLWAGFQWNSLSDQGSHGSAFTADGATVLEVSAVGGVLQFWCKNSYCTTASRCHNLLYYLT